MYGHADIMEQLISNGASVRASNSDCLPLIVVAACEQTCRSNWAEVLILKMAYFNARGMARWE